MSGRYTIGQLARAAQVPVSTVRYYERRRLLRADARSQANYRLYGPESLQRLQFVRSAQAAGFTLSDVCLLLEFRDDNKEACCQVQSLIEGRLAQVRDALGRLQQVEDLLARWLRACRRSVRPETCGVLEVLAGAAPKEQGRFPRKRA